MAIVEATQFFVYVAGSDVSTRFASRLIKLTVTDTAGRNADTATIELDDTYGSIGMPQEKASVIVALGTSDGGVMQVFDGVVDDVNHIFDRGAGRRITVEAKSADTHGKQKEEQTIHNDDKSVQDAVKEAAQKAGVEMSFPSGLGNEKRKYIAQDHESFLHFAERMAREVGATFKMIGGKRGVFLDRNSGKTVGGGAVGNVTAQVGKNLITSRISPILSRPAFADVRARWYDVKKAKWMEEKVQIEGDGGGKSEDVAAHIRHSKFDAAEGKEHGKSAGKESSRDKGSGTVVIDGNPAARAEGICTVVGVRPGVDGAYIIDNAKHELARGSGYRTTLTLKRPGGEAGKDSRKAGKSSGGGKGTGGGGETQWPNEFD
ncbi:phage late control D family protein [Bradyrhizobium valentinum]|uniref:Late control protein n=1 Tax=Bradyrhizobium valentinum TaxID=1518501 RepID=A0A0R3KWX4_9BRAD|nr:contractile injection system protein, VgrG/Pvc8 family [Bradyrhizobium valentinum]KRQ99293.1 hypothetical protein CP49_11900 [Bradyrhizobium valentinum]